MVAGKSKRGGETAISSDYFNLLTFDFGKVRFASSDSGHEEYHTMFAMQVPNHPVLFGEWRPMWSANGNDYNVEVFDFGLLRCTAAGDPASSPSRYSQCFTSQERFVIEKLVHKLFDDNNSKSGVFPISSTKARFLGGINFVPGWVREC